MEEKILEERIYSPNPDKWLNKYKKTYRSERQLEIKELKNGVILPLKKITDEWYNGGACDENLNFIGGLIKDPNITGSQKYVYDSYVVEDDEISYIDEEVLFGGVLQNHPGHLAIDSFAARMWWVIDHPDSDIKIAIVTMWENRQWGEGTHDFIKEYFDLFGIPEERIIIVKEPTRFKSVIVPEQCAYIAREFNDKYTEVADKLKSAVESGPYEKVFFTKKNTARQDIMGEEYFIDFFKNKGFAIIQPEDYSIKDTISILKGAKEYVALNGTNSVYLLFCNTDVKFILLERDDNDPSVQALINQARGVTDFYSVDVSLSFIAQNFVRGIKLLGVTDEWRQFVKDYYNEDIKETREDTLKKYSYDYLVKFTECYSNSKMLNAFKKWDHVTIMQNLNRVFLGRYFDPNDYVVESIPNYRNQIAAFKSQIDEINANSAQQKHIFDETVSKVVEAIEKSFSIKMKNKADFILSMSKPQLTYQINVRGEKWRYKTIDEQISGEENNGAPVVSVKITPDRDDLHVYYAVYTQDGGWTADVRDGAAAGSVKKAVPIQGLRIRLDDEISGLYSVKYRVYTHPKGWTAWAADGQATAWRTCKMIDAIQIRVDYKEDFDTKRSELLNEFLKEMSECIAERKTLPDNATSKTADDEIADLRNKVVAQEYVIKSLENTLSSILNGLKKEDT